MKIEIKKTTDYNCEYILTRLDESKETIALETKTYLVHDVSHYVVEKNLNYSQGFWGMLSQGFTFNELFGKNNPLTEELRFIEQVVGPIQSIYSGYIPKQEVARCIEHLDIELSQKVLNNCLSEIETILGNWAKLTIGQSIILVWEHEHTSSSMNQKWTKKM